MSLIHRTTHCGSNKVIKLNFVGKKCIVGEQQHGFKENKSTATAGLFLQSLIAWALNDSNYVAMANIDLSAALTYLSI